MDPRSATGALAPLIDQSAPCRKSGNTCLGHPRDEGHAEEVRFSAGWLHSYTATFHSPPNRRVRHPARCSAASFTLRRLPFRRGNEDRPRWPRSRASLLSPPRGRLEPPHTHARGIITSDGSVRHPGEPLPKFDWIWSIPFIVHSFIASSSPPAYLPRLPDSGVTLPTNLPTSNTQISTIPISNNMRAGTAFPFFPMAGRQHTLTLSTFLSYMTRSKK